MYSVVNPQAQSDVKTCSLTYDRTQVQSSWSVFGEGNKKERKCAEGSEQIIYVSRKPRQSLQCPHSEEQLQN